MPLGFERLNERQQRPNPNINFIKPLEGPDKAVAEEFLSRIAAQCLPVMKKHHISVMALEEYEPNPEFLGRNFNAGEVIQLVLKDKQGRWLSMKFVQMVMMHELAHCKQMNHSRFFWNVRNEYAQQMEGLWREEYTGEGMWGRGRGLENGAFINAAPPDNTQIPEHLCGGSYRRKGRKRKRGQNGRDEQENLSYAERQQRRIARKFGKHGDGSSLGDDELLRGALETMNGGKRGQGKPRVANSKRGRELRAAAALARFGQAKKEEQTPEPEDDMDSETESEGDDEVDRNAVTVKDGRGRDLVKVCGDDQDDEEDANKEMDELRMLSAAPKRKLVRVRKSNSPARGEQGHKDSETESEAEEPRSSTVPAPSGKAKAVHRAPRDRVDSETESESDDKPPIDPDPAIEQTDEGLSASQADLLREVDGGGTSSQASETATLPAPAPTSAPENVASAVPGHVACPVCSVENEADALLCMVCSHVLRSNLVADCWRCKSETCKGSQYLNAGDVGRCGLCGAQKPKMASAPTGGPDGRPIGITRPEVLR
ncbi:hypothetical protein M409DRAFT_23387 [Zasmidium cellare ATCC 36951]|uniref:WLM domain-containing protein n=1 Tax=Zasmidium cellare ATCC 36951 TaxID=1080233 RepID=A0A6A6CJ38_ZASCE|nr:uncharacterized protein M409DRAFT_23387 [Zasmidium cellare ATCC 36951]KAF2166198.1 hypothetical protein M409DRAFT_23387 [Zasmidium cellare ATCC 36951]